MIDTQARARAFWTEVFNARDLGHVEDFVAPEMINHNARPGTPNGPDGVRELCTRLWTGFSDMRFDIGTLVGEGEKVVCVGTMNGTHDGAFRGMAPTNRRTSARHMHLLTFNHTGMIIDHLAVRDDIALLRQLGALPEPGPLGPLSIPSRPVASPS
jgi:predicted ester cyclase